MPSMQTGAVQVKKFTVFQDAGGEPEREIRKVAEESVKNSTVVKEIFS